jgi:hypothetical protein
MDNLANSVLERNMNTAIVKSVERVPNVIQPNIRIIKLRNNGVHIPAKVLRHRVLVS